MLSPAYVQSETLGILPATAKPFEILYDLFFHQTICGSPQLVKIAGLSSLTMYWYRRLESRCREFQQPRHQIAEIVRTGRRTSSLQVCLQAQGLLCAHIKLHLYPQESSAPGGISIRRFPKHRPKLQLLQKNNGRRSNGFHEVVFHKPQPAAQLHSWLKTTRLPYTSPLLPPLLRRQIA